MKLYIYCTKNEIENISDTTNDSHDFELEINSIDEFEDYAREHDLIPNEEVYEKLNVFFGVEDNDSESLSSFKINHWVSNRSYGELIDMYENDEIIVPDMQRSFVWDSAKSSRLIESIIMGLPIPPLFLLEISDNKYELIDGYQRLTTLSNYVNERPWAYTSKIISKNNRASRLSKVATEIEGQKFSELKMEYQRKIKRSTIPLIEFNQVDPDNYQSKYLIFERINTGSIKLNPMQIRKALSHGEFILSLYDGVETMTSLKELFTVNSLNNDRHVEAILRTICFYNSYYNNVDLSKDGIKTILNIYSEQRKDIPVNKSDMQSIDTIIKKLIDIFGAKNIFRRVIKDKNQQYIFDGNMNISIFESFVSAILHYEKNGDVIDYSLMYELYKDKIFKCFSENGGKNNPFSVSTGSRTFINQRFQIFDELVKQAVRNV